MSASGQDRIVELPELRDRLGVFRDRADAGRVLADMLAPLPGGPAMVLAVPAGGVPVAAVIARRLDLPLGLAVVSKITPSWSSEVGYGAVAWDGTVQLNQDVLPAMGVSEREIREDTARTVEKVRRRAAALRGESPMPDLAGRTAILVDDGLASGFTMQVAVQAVRNAGGQRIVVAV
ncbi:MAG: phosphoribosyltransferase, partial [Phycisphaerae bacterium SM23_33]